MLFTSKCCTYPSRLSGKQIVSLPSPREQIARERVVAALEASAKLPVDKAEDIEGAIFALVGCLVGKVLFAILG